MNKLLIVGSVAIDSLKTQTESKPGLLGGAACYASIASSYFAPSAIVAIVGNDFPKEHTQLLQKHNVDLTDLQEVEGKTFRWAGEYAADMNIRTTLSLDLGVFADFMPQVSANNRETPFVMLANIAPKLQMHVLKQVKKPLFVLADTMDFYINSALEDLKELLTMVDCLSLNDSEARLLTQKENLLEAIREIHKMGPKYVIVKKGEHGSILSSPRGLFLAPAYPLPNAKDPTGAGDTFAGSLMGYLAKNVKTADEIDTFLRKAMLVAASVSAYCCEDFGVSKVAGLSENEINNRVTELEKMISL